jgi:hypothetical protein
LDSFGVFEGFQITIEVPFAYSQREQLLDFIQSKFPGAEISAVHSEVADPTVAEVLVRRDTVTDSAKSDSAISGLDSEAVLLKATEALAEFTKSTN